MSVHVFHQVYDKLSEWCTITGTQVKRFFIIIFFKLAFEHVIHIFYYKCLVFLLCLVNFLSKLHSFIKMEQRHSRYVQHLMNVYCNMSKMMMKYDMITWSSVIQFVYQEFFFSSIFFFIKIWRFKDKKPTCGTCVDFPQPVSPTSTNVWYCSKQYNIWSRYLRIGRRSRCASIANEWCALKTNVVILSSTGWASRSEANESSSVNGSKREQKNLDD